jgi:hypothetical protein
MKPDFNPKIITQKEIFSERQLREFTVNIKAVIHNFPRNCHLTIALLLCSRQLTMMIQEVVCWMVL